MATLNAATVAVNFVAGTAEYVGGLDKATRAGESWERSLRRQIQTMEMGSDASRLYDLALRGADMSVRDSIRSLLERKAAMEAAAESERRAAERTAAVQREAAALYEQTRTPAERYAVQVANLRDMLSRGAVSQEVYNRALAQAREQFQQTSGASQRAADIQRKAAEQRAAAEKKAAEQAAQAARLHQEAVARGRAVYDQTRTPAERYRTTIGELGVMLRKGHIDQTTYSRAMANARNEMMQSSAAFQGLTGGLSGVLAATGPIGIAIGVAIAAVTGLAVAAGAAGIALFNMGLRGGESIGKLLDASEAMGVTTQALAEMRTAAELNGSSADAMGTGMQKLTQVLGDAVGGTEAAQKAFARLGLNFEQLAGMTPDAVFRATAEAIANIQNPYEQASAAQDIFGKNYAALMPLLKAGPQAFEEGAEKARMFGLAVGQVDAMRVDQAMDSWKQIGMIFAGIAQSLAVELAPLIKEIGDGFASMAERVGGVGPFISSFVSGAISGLAAVGDTVMTLGKLYWDYLGKPINDVHISVMQGIKNVAGALGGLEYVLTGESNVGDAIQDMADSYMQQLRKTGKINDEAFKAWSNRTFQDRAKDFMAAAKAQRSAMEKSLTPPVAPEFKKPEDKTAAEQMDRNQKIIADLQFQADTFGMNAKQIAIYKMALDGATASQMEEAAALYDKLEGMKQQQAMMDEGKKLTESVMTEEEKRAKQLERYQELLESGAISQETYDRAVNKMQERTDMKDLGGQEVKSIASREIRFNASIPGAKRFTDELKAPTKETAKNTESIAKSAEETRDLIKERFGFDVVEIL